MPDRDRERRGFGERLADGADEDNGGEFVLRSLYAYRDVLPTVLRPAEADDDEDEMDDVVDDDDKEEDDDEEQEIDRGGIDVVPKEELGSGWEPLVHHTQVYTHIYMPVLCTTYTCTYKMYIHMCTYWCA